LLGQWTIELEHVAAIVGGFNSQEKYVGQEGVIYSPVARARQVDAVKFLNENAFATPTWVIDPQILRRIEPFGALSRVRNAQSIVLSGLMSGSRFARLVEQEAIDGAGAYGPTEFLADVRKGIWKELDSPRIKIDAYRRNLQHSYLDLVNNKLNGTSANPGGFGGFFAASADERPFHRADLKALDASIAAALAKASDRETRAHLEGARDQIARILDPRFAPPAGNNSSPRFSIGDQLDSCWPDYMIRP